jgi:hypothetical protein
MKRRWREVLSEWKEQTTREGKNYASIPKQCFPGLLKKVLEKDFGPAIRSGFEATGLYPFSKAKVLSKLPQEQREVDTAVQGQLLKRLSDMRYNPPPTTQAKRPRKKEKLPPGASYTCSAEDEAVDDLHSSSDNSYSSDSSEEEAERSAEVRKIVARIQKKKILYAKKDIDLYDAEEQPARDQPEEEPAQDQPEEEPAQGLLQEPAGDAVQDYPPETYVVAVYQGEWYVGQIVAKEGEPEAEEADEYVLISFMQRTSGDLLKWPKRSDLLNMLKEDILFACQPPTPSQSTSSSRSVTFSLSKADAKKARKMFLTKAYYPTTTTFATLDSFECTPVCSLFVYVCVLDVCVCLMCAWSVQVQLAVSLFMCVCVLDVSLCVPKYHSQFGGIIF